jgi:hypothetical protein
MIIGISVDASISTHTAILLEVDAVLKHKYRFSN